MLAYQSFCFSTSADSRNNQSRWHSFTLKAALFCHFLPHLQIRAWKRGQNEHNMTIVPFLNSRLTTIETFKSFRKTFLKLRKIFYVCDELVTINFCSFLK